MSDAAGSHTENPVGDEEFIRRVRDGDTGAYATLYERHVPAARGLARQLVRGEAEAEDAVAEAFTRVLSLIRRGGGPESAFRPYLLTAVRNAAHDRGRGEKRQVVTDDIEVLDPGQPFVDPALEGLERSLIAQAFLSLPERWQSVLWHTEIEGAKPAQAALTLGMKPNSVAALAYRAREGLRQAYLQMHLAGGNASEGCRPTLGLLGAHVRGALSRRDSVRVDRHMDACADCREVYAELADVNVGLRGTVLPLVAGAGAAGYLTTTPAGTAAGAWWGRMSRRQQQVTAAGAAAAGTAVAVALALTGVQEPAPQERPPAATAPWESPPAPPEPAPNDPPAQDPPAPPEEQGPPPPEPEQGPRPPEPAPPEEEEAVPERTTPPADVPEAEVPDQEAREPRFAVGIDPVGALLPGSDGIMVLDVRNIGDHADEEVVALLTLPPGVEMVSSGGAGNAVPMTGGHGDWSCSATSGGGRCVGPAMAAGQNGTHFIDVRVAPDADTGVPATVSVSSGEVTVHASGERGVSAEGATARYAAAGRVRTESVGNTLVSCVGPEWPDRWPWRPHVSAVPEGGDTGPRPGTEARAPHEVPDAAGDGPSDAESPAPERSEPENAVPGEEDVPPAEEEAPDGTEGGPDDPVPAEPEEDADGEEPDEGDSGPGPRIGGERWEGPCAQARQRQGPFLDNDHWLMVPRDTDHDPTTTASSSAVWELPEQGRVRWAGLYFSAAGEPEAPSIRVRGPGMAEYQTLTATDTRTAELPGYTAYQAFVEVTDLVRERGGGRWWVGDAPARRGFGLHAGWSLVVVLEDPQVDTWNQAMVLDDTRTVFRGEGGGPFTVSGLLPAAVPARIDVVAWEGDAGLRGDRVTVDGTAVGPVDGHGRADNAFTGSARGAEGDPLAFGTDVVRFDSVLGRETDIRILSERDAVMVGVVALTAPMRI